MAPSFMKKTMVYLGLLDDEYDEYDDLRTAPRGGSRPPPRVEPRPQEHDQAEEFSGGMSRVRTISPRVGRPEPSPRPAAEPRSPRPVGGAGHAGRHRHRRAAPSAPPRPGCTSWPRPASATPRRSPTG